MKRDEAGHKTTKMIETIVVVLLLARLALPDLLVRVKFIVESIQGSAYFVTPNPPMLDVDAARVALADAITVAKKNPSRENKKKVKDRKKELMELMEKVREYVQGIARANPVFAENIAAAAGLYLKNFPGKSPQTYGVMNTGVPGTVALIAAVQESGIYNWQMTLTPTNEDSWTTFAITRKADVMKGGLTSVKKYYFRVGNGGDVETEVFSVVFSIVVQ